MVSNKRQSLTKEAPYALNSSDEKSSTLKNKNQRLKQINEAFTQVFVHLRRLSNTGEIFEKLVKIDDKSPKTSVISGFHTAEIFFASAEFLMLPLLFLSAKILGIKQPFHLTHAGKLLYSGSILALSIGALIVPHVAIPLGLTSASLGMIVSTVILFKAIHNKYKLKRELATIEQKSLTTNDAQKKLEFEQQKQQLEKEIDKINLSHIFNRATSAFLASTSLIGVILSLFFPHVGIAIIASSALIGLGLMTYNVTKSSLKLLSRTKENIKNDIVENKTSIDEKPKEEKITDSTLRISQSLKTSSSSTATAKNTAQVQAQSLKTELKMARNQRPASSEDTEESKKTLSPTNE